LLVYGADDTLAFLYEHRHALAPWFAMALPDEPLAGALIDKARFYELASRRRVRVPRTAGTEGPGGTDTTLDDLRPPLIVKPRSKHDKAPWHQELFGKQKARVFETREALADHPTYQRHQAELLVQERIEGSIADLVSYHGYSDGSGTPLLSFCGRKLRTYPRVAGESALIEIIEDDALSTTGEWVARRLGLVGPYKIDLIRDRRDGELCVLEVNARFNLWHQLGAAYGVNLPLAAYDHLVLGREPSPPSHRRPRVRWADLYRNMLACREGESLAEVARSLLTAPNVYPTFSWSDPGPAMAWLGGMFKQKVVNVALRHRR